MIEASTTFVSSEPLHYSQYVKCIVKQPSPYAEHNTRILEKFTKWDLSTEIFDFSEEYINGEKVSKF